MTGELPFVGRSDELRSLRSWLGEAMSDGTRVVSVSGEPGVGKTRLLDRFAGEVVRQHQPVKVLRATCYQDARVPYLPLATALRPVGDLSTLLQGDDAPERAHERQLHLYVGAADLLAGAAASQSLVVIVDDLHWADQGTLDLLTHLVHAVTPVLWVVFHRPVTSGPAALFLDRMLHTDWRRDVELTGLDPFALHELVEALTGERPARKLLDGLQEASGGNPMLIRALLNRLDAFGMLVLRDGLLTQRGGEEVLAGPAELDGLLRHRLRDLSRPCLDVLTITAFFGEGHALDDARAVARTSEVRFDTAVAEAVEAGVLRDDESIRFDHPQLRHVLYQRPRGARRHELHLKVADQLERQHGDDPSGVVAIAHHLRRAGALPDADRVLRANLAAARQAAAMVAWGEAALAYDAAIEIERATGEEASAFRALLHARAAYAHWYNHDNPATVEHAQAAIEIASALGDLAVWAEGLVMLGRGWWSGDNGAFGSTHDVTPFDMFLEAAGDREPQLRARVHRARGSLQSQATPPDRGREDLDTAIRLAQESDDLPLLADVEFPRAWLHMFDIEFARSIELYEHSRDSAIACGQELLRVTSLRGLAMVQWAAGDLYNAAATAQEAVDRARPIAAWAECSTAMGALAGVAVAQGRYDDAEAIAAEADRMVRWAAYPAGHQLLLPVVACASAHRGDVAGAHSALDQWELAMPRGVGRFRSLVHAMAGEFDRVRPFHARPAPERPTLFDLAVLAIAVEIGDRLDDLERIAWAAPGITSLAERGARFDIAWCFFVPRLAGVAALRLGKLTDAQRWLDLATREAERAGAAMQVELVARDRLRLDAIVTRASK